MVNDIPSMFVIQDVLVSADIITEPFCCDIEACQGKCCEEGNAGAPITLDELAYLEEHLDEMWPHMSATAQAIVDKQGVAYTDPEGELVTSICNGKDCCFRGSKGCLMKERPISCFLYPIREKVLSNGMSALSYNRWDVCHTAVKKGREIGLPIYKFLEGPLTRRFGEDWYKQLLEVAEAMKEEGYL